MFFLNSGKTNQTNMTYHDTIIQILLNSVINYMIMLVHKSNNILTIYIVCLYIYILNHVFLICRLYVLNSKYETKS